MKLKDVKIGMRVEVSKCSIEFLSDYTGERGIVTAISPTGMLPVEVRLDSDGHSVPFDNGELFEVKPKAPTAPMTKEVLGHLVKVGDISGDEANSIYRCKSLTRRICDLKALGWLIDAVHKQDNTGKRYVRYFLNDFQKENMKGIAA